MRRIASCLATVSLAVSLGTALAASPASAADDTATTVVTEAPADPTAEAALETVRALVTDQPAPAAAAAAADGVNPTIAMAQLAATLPELSGAQQRQARRLLARPTDPRTNGHAVTYPSDAVLDQLCGPNICVTYAAKGSGSATPGWAATTLAELERAWEIEVNQLGYRPPPADTGGIDGRLDVYLLDVGQQGYYGYCAPEPKPVTQRALVTSYCVLDNDMAGFDMPPLPSLKVTAAHEFFHTIQFGYDAAEDGWVMENTATWMEEQAADAINDNRQFLTGSQIRFPGRPLDEFSTGPFDYGNWIFFQRMSQRLGTQSVRELWELLDAGGRDLYSTQGVVTLINSKGVSWRDFYADFVAGNHAPQHFYAEGARYPRAVAHRHFQLKPGQRSARATFPRLRHLSSRSVQFNRGARLPRSAQLRVRVTSKKGTAAMPAARVLIFDKSGTVSSVAIKLNRAGAGTSQIRFGNRINRVIVVLANSSTRMDRCWTYSNFACSGYGRDDDQTMAVHATVVAPGSKPKPQPKPKVTGS